MRLLLNVPLPLTGAWLGMHRQGELAIADHKIGEAARCRRLPEKPDPDGVLVTCTELRGLDDGPYTFVLFVASTAAFGAFTYAFVPETKGRSLREVTASFDSLSTSPLQ